MPYCKSYLEDLSNIDSFDLECAKNIRIPILENNSSNEQVIILKLYFPFIFPNYFSVLNPSQQKAQNDKKKTLLRSAQIIKQLRKEKS